MVQFQQPVNYSNENVRELRNRAGLSRQALVDKLAERGVSLHQTSLRRIEEGSQAVKIEEAQAFAEIFNLSLEEFITRPVDSKAAELRALIQGCRANLENMQNNFSALHLSLDTLRELVQGESTPPPERSALTAEAVKLMELCQEVLDDAQGLRKKVEESGVAPIMDLPLREWGRTEREKHRNGEG